MKPEAFPRHIEGCQRRIAPAEHRALLAKASKHFYFWSGEAADWLDRTVQVATISDLTLYQWIDEFGRLKKLNTDIVESAGAARPLRPGRTKTACGSSA